MYTFSDSFHYNVVLVSGLQQSDSVFLHICIYIHKIQGVYIYIYIMEYNIYNSIIYIIYIIPTYIYLYIYIYNVCVYIYIYFSDSFPL